MADNTLSRRKFLKSTAAATTAFTIVPRHVLGGANHTPPSEKLNIAGIGIGGMGGGNVNNCQHENIFALCDVDFANAAHIFNKYPNAKRYKDFRVMLEKEPDIDAVIIGTPDHTHATISMAAMKAGKHVFCQKPLTQNVHEARVLTQAAKSTGVVTQMGIQRHSDIGPRLICEWVADGALGTVDEVVAWSSLSYYPWGHAYWSSSHSTRPVETPPVPDSLDWDLWLGPAPVRPYHRCYHPGSWRSWWDFGTGMLGDRGIHTLDSVFWSLKLGQPTSVQATSVGSTSEIHPIASIITYEFISHLTNKPVKVTWYDGLTPPRPDDLEPGRRFGGSEGGILMIGDKAKLMSNYTATSPRLIPETKMKAYKQPEPSIPRITCSHEQDWINAIKNGTKAGADFDYSGPLTEAVLLGNIAKKFPDRILKYDAKNMKITNDEEANKHISRQYRDGWTL